MMYLHIFGAILFLCVLLVLGTWLTSHVIPHRSPGFVLWWKRLLTCVRILAAVSLLVGTFLFGMLLTWPDFPYNPSGFPIGRKFVAVSLNNEPLIRPETVKLATLEVRGRFTFRHRVGGNALCNDWGGHVTFLPARWIVWGTVFRTATYCPSASELENEYIRALLGASRWRTEGDTLILHNGTGILRFKLAAY